VFPGCAAHARRAARDAHGARRGADRMRRGAARGQSINQPSQGDNLVTRSGGVQRTKRVTLKPQSGRAIVRDNLLVLRRQGPWFAKAQTR